MPALDQFRHLAVEEGEQQRADVGAVHVGVGHHDDLVIAQLADIEFLAADAGAQRRDQRADFHRGEHLVEARALDVEDLAAQGQHRLVVAVAALLGGATGAVTLDDEEFAARGIAFLAIGELAGKRGDIERALAAGQFTGLAGGLSGGGGFHDLLNDGTGIARMFLEPGAERIVDVAFDDRAHLGGDELVLRLRGELGIGHLDREHAGHAFARVIAGQRHLLLLGDAGVLAA